MASSWFLFFSYHSDAWSNKHQMPLKFEHNVAEHCTHMWLWLKL